MRSGPHVAAALTTFVSQQPMEIRLLDWNEERMDLIDRLARQMLKKAEQEHQIKSSTDLEESLDGADHLILSIYEDSARRLLGPAPEPVEDEEEPDERGMSVVEHGLGDLNKPTPYEHLSQQTKLMLHRPNLDLDREEVIRQVSERVLREKPEACRVLSLVRDVEIQLPEGAEKAAWPQPLSEAERQIAPHQILRWINEDHSIYDLLKEAEYSPVTRWLLQV